MNTVNNPSFYFAYDSNMDASRMESRMTDDTRKPSQEYLGHLIAGAINFHLSQPTINKLRNTKTLES